MTDEEIRETRLKVLEKDLASINNRLHHAFNQGFELGRKSTTPKEKTNWIPVSERLPESDEYIGDVAKYYLVQNEYGDMLVARYTHSEYWEQIYQLKPIDDKIIAWMPLPKPYKEGKNE